MPERKWITRKEILHQTGLSGPELDEYIAIGILPDPGSSDTYAGLPGADKNDIFPSSVIWRINLVNRLKQQGESMEAIAGQFGDIAMVEEMTFPDENEQKFISKQNIGLDDEGTQLSLEADSTDETGDHPEEEDAPILLENELSGIPESAARSENTSETTETPPEPESQKRVKAIFGKNRTCAVSVSVVSVCLQHLDELSDALMPEDYFDLLNQIYKCLGAAIANHKGVAAGWENTRLCCCFFEQEETNYIMDSISCAFDMQDHITTVNKTIKQRHQGVDDICLNIGIAVGREVAGILQFNGEFGVKVLGETTAYARRLSEFGSNGDVWATKSGIGAMASDDVKAISFGVPRLMNNQIHFIPHAFSKMKHIISDDIGMQNWSDIAELPVTCVKGIIRTKKNSV